MQPVPSLPEASILDYLRTRVKLPWRVLAGLGFALGAQLVLEPPQQDGWLGALLYLVAVGWIIWGVKENEIRMVAPEQRQWKPDSGTVRLVPLLITAPLAALAFWFFGGNRFTGLNLALWAASILGLVWAFREGPNPFRRIWDWIINFRYHPRWVFVITDRTAAFALLAAVALFFRVYRLETLPPEMYSDHAEKLLDVAEIMLGQYSIFFERNTGREMFQMYLTAGVAQVFGTGLSFMSLKIGATVAGLLTLPFVYWLGKEYGGPRVGWLSAYFAAIAYWLNVITRVALRYTLYPFFVAPVLFYVVRGLRRGSRNDMLLAGMFLGLGLHGYSAFRVVPILVLVAFILYFLHTKHALRRWQAAWHLGVLIVIALAWFLPLLRYILESPAHLNQFFYRSLTRITNLEQGIPGSPVEIFFREMWDGLSMFWGNNGDIWVHSIRNRPALDVVSAALFMLGLVFLLYRYLRTRSWADLFLLVSVVVLLLPSTLSLAFPGENPSLNRSGGAMIPTVVVIALALETILGAVQRHWSGWVGKGLSGLILVGLVLWAGVANYTLVFDQYAVQYRTFILNTSEVGAAVRTLAHTSGSSDNVWVVPYPHWVDTRLVGIEAGFPLRDFARTRDDLPSTMSIPGTKACVFHPDDQQTLDALMKLYPTGVVQRFESAYGRDFLMFMIPP